MLFIFSALAFLLSAIIDNLTATIVLVTILQKVIKEKKLRLWFAGLVVIAANAGGAWAPIGDVTTTMLWIADKVTVPMLLYYVFIPSVVCMVVPVYIASFLKPFKGNLDKTDLIVYESKKDFCVNYETKFLEQYINESIDYLMN